MVRPEQHYLCAGKRALPHTEPGDDRGSASSRHVSFNNVSILSLDFDVCYFCVEGVKNGLFCGSGGDRTVRVNKTAVLIIGDHTDHDSQCSQCDAKESGWLIMSTFCVGLGTYEAFLVSVPNSLLSTTQLTSKYLPLTVLRWVSVLKCEAHHLCLCLARTLCCGLPVSTPVSQSDSDFILRASLWHASA